jgi:hypothetical protein
MDELLLSIIECPAGGGGGGGIRQTQIQTAEPFVPQPSIFDLVIAIGKLKRCRC